LNDKFHKVSYLFVLLDVSVSVKTMPYKLYIEYTTTDNSAVKVDSSFSCIF